MEVRSSVVVMEAQEGRAGTHSCREERDEVDGSRADRTVLHAKGRDVESRDSTSVASAKQSEKASISSGRRGDRRETAVRTRRVQGSWRDHKGQSVFVSEFRGAKRASRANSPARDVDLLLNRHLADDGRCLREGVLPTNSSVGQGRSKIERDRGSCVRVGDDGRVGGLLSSDEEGGSRGGSRQACRDGDDDEGGDDHLEVLLCIAN